VLRLLAAGALALALVPAAHAASLKAYPSSESIAPTGSLPNGGSSSITLNVAVGETEDAQIVVAGAKNVAAAIDGAPLQPLASRLLWGHYVSFGAKRVPDALLPWNGSARASEAANQPLWVQVGVPEGTAPGAYVSKVVVDADGVKTEVPITVQVFGVSIPPFANASGNLAAAFNLSPQSYVNKVAALFSATNTQRIEINANFFRFLAEHRINPNNWGFGEPRGKQAYDRSAKWWLDTGGNMERQLQTAGAFSAMRIPISNNRTSTRNWAGGIDPSKPETWCDYLKSVHDFWASHNWLSGSNLAFIYGQDEPGLAGQHLVARQAEIAHRCWAGSKVLLTGNPTSDNRFLWNGGSDDADIWTVLSRRFYGSYSNPKGRRREHDFYNPIQAVRARGKTVWSYTYSGTPGSPGYSGTEPLSDVRVLLLWNALEHTTGTLYGENMTDYGPGNPLQAVSRHGDFVLIYPGASEPVTSARLEQIRDGIEDWAIYNVVYRKRGIGAVRAILGGKGIFSASSAGVKLGCSQYCDLHSSTKYAWPVWSQDSTTPRKIEAAKLAALQAATG
jgi:Glycoside hydrolase 123, catalytic domain